MTRAPIVIVGAGAIGGAIGSALALGGDDVTLVDADHDHVKAIHDSGLTVVEHGRERKVPIPAWHVDDAPLGTWPIVLLCVKAHHTEAAMRSIASRLPDHGFVVSVQNGLCEPVVARHVGIERTVGAFVNLFADRTAPGVVTLGGPGTLAIGELDGHPSERVVSLVERLQAWGPAITTDNVLGYLWSKLAYGAVLVATATTDETMADVLADAGTRPALLALAREVLDGAAAEGVRAEPFDMWDPRPVFGPAADAGAADRMLDEQVAHLRRASKSRSGVWRDLAVVRRPTEVAAIYGPVLELATQRGAHIPKLRWLIATIAEIEAGRRVPTTDHLAELRAA